MIRHGAPVPTASIHARDSRLSITLAFGAPTRNTAGTFGRSSTTGVPSLELVAGPLAQRLQAGGAKRVERDDRQPLEQPGQPAGVLGGHHARDHVAELEQERGDVEPGGALAGELGAEEGGVALELAGGIAAGLERGRSGSPEAATAQRLDSRFATCAVCVAALVARRNRSGRPLEPDDPAREDLARRARSSMASSPAEPRASFIHCADRSKPAGGPP